MKFIESGHMWNLRYEANLNWKNMKGNIKLMIFGPETSEHFHSPEKVEPSIGMKKR